MANFEELRALVRYAFPQARSGREEVFKQALDFSTVYSIENDKKLQSMLLSLHYDVFWKNKIAKMSGIGLVASYPEARGQGHVRQLMTQLLQEEYENGTELSYLSPFSSQFYRRFGYEDIFQHKIYEIKMSDWPKGEFGKVQRLAYEEILPEIMRLHEKEASLGNVRRSKLQWDYHFQMRYQPMFALTENGYLIYQFDGSKFVILELTALDEAAKQRLYGFISAHSSGFENVLWKTSNDCQLEQDLPEPRRAGIQLQPDMMARIVNLPAFFKLNGQPDFPVKINDPILPQNNGIYGSSGYGQALSLTIGQFTARILREHQAVLREEF